MIPEWVRNANPASWALLNLIGQTTTLPLSLGGLNVSTGQAGGVLAFTSSNTVSSTAGGTSTQVLHGHATLPFYGAVVLTADVTGLLPFANGGTGASTVAGVSTNLRLSTMAYQAASTVAVTGGTINGTAIGNTTASTGLFTSVSTTALLMGGPARLKGYFVSTLPAGTQGDVAFVVDSATSTFLSTVAGGGAVTTAVFFNGTAWVAF